jgi:hypothetical protein
MLIEYRPQACGPARRELRRMTRRRRLPVLLVGVLAVFLAVGASCHWREFPAHLWRRPEPNGEGSHGSDVPVVIRTSGGMLEVATVRHRRNFNLTNVLTVAGLRIPFCKATASYTLDVALTYRVRLARDWSALYRDKRLEITAPRLEPSLPVAFDTTRMRTALQECPFMPPGTQAQLLRLISGQLEKDAEGPAYLQLAENGGARETVREFVRKWLVSQKAYDIPTDIPIDVTFQP